MAHYHDKPRVIISAGAGGIGLVVARRFKRAGALVAVCDIEPEAINRVTGEFDHAETRDITDAAGTQAFVNRSVEQLGGVDTIIANAGSAGPTALLEDVSPEDWSQTLAVNLSGQFNLLKAAIPHLKAQRHGTVLLMSSVAGRLGYPMRAPYAVAKWGVIGLKETLAMELGPFGISVNAILPGSVKGGRMDAVLKAKSEVLGQSIDEVTAAEVGNVSMGKMIDPQEIADLAWFLASPSAASISGQSIGICGNLETLR